MESILIVEDDASIRLGLEMNLKQEGYSVHSAGDGETGYHLALDKRPDLIILDVMLPKMSGFEICKALRKQEIMTPVIMVTCRTDEVDKIMGLDLGADDYISKPFSLRELLARVNAALRRQRAYESASEVFSFGPFHLDIEGQVLYRNGTEPMDLSQKEFHLLRYLLQNAGRVLSRDQILKKVWGYDYFGTDRTVDNFVNKLRQKIEDDQAKPRFIQTVRGAGYKFTPEGVLTGTGKFTVEELKPLGEKGKKK